MLSVACYFNEEYITEIETINKIKDKINVDKNNTHCFICISLYLLNKKYTCRLLLNRSTDWPIFFTKEFFYYG